METIRTKRHPMYLVQSTTILCVLVACALLWVQTHPRCIIPIHKMLGTATFDPVLISFATHAAALAALPSIFAILSLVTRYLSWNFNTFELDRTSLAWSRWPAASESIALLSIADVSWTKPSIFAFLFDYGTLTIDAGRVQEQFSFIPSIEYIATEVRRRGR